MSTQIPSLYKVYTIVKNKKDYDKVLLIFSRYCLPPFALKDIFDETETFIIINTSSDLIIFPNYHNVAFLEKNNYKYLSLDYIFKHM